MTQTKLIFQGHHSTISVNCNHDDLEKLPNVFFIGPSRTSTTFLYEHLRKKENIYVPQIKELHFLSLFDFRCRGPWERSIHHSGINFEELAKKPDSTIHTRIVSSFSDYIELFEGAEQKQFRIDISPSYHFYSERVSNNIEKNFKNALVYFTPRDPILRMLSNYSCLFPRCPKTLFSAINDEDSVLKKSWEFFWALKGQSQYAATVSNFKNKDLNFYIIPYEKIFTEDPFHEIGFFDFRKNDQYVNRSSVASCIELLDDADLIISFEHEKTKKMLANLNITSKISDPFPISQIYSCGSKKLIGRLAGLFYEDVMLVAKEVQCIDKLWGIFNHF